MSKNLFNTVVYGSFPVHITCKQKIRINWYFGNNPLLLIPSDLYHKMMLLESLNIPLITYNLCQKLLLNYKEKISEPISSGTGLHACGRCDKF